MGRKHKEENQRPVNTAKEESGASKRKRKEELERSLQASRAGLAKFLKLDKNKPQEVQKSDCFITNRYDN